MKQVTDEAISKNLIEAINSCAKPKGQIAREAHIANSTLSAYLSGKCQPSLTTFKLLCKAIDCSADEILDLKFYK